MFKKLYTPLKGNIQRYASAWLFYHCRNSIRASNVNYKTFPIFIWTSPFTIAFLDNQISDFLISCNISSFCGAEWFIWSATFQWEGKCSMPLFSIIFVSLGEKLNMFLCLWSFSQWRTLWRLVKLRQVVLALQHWNLSLRKKGNLRRRVLGHT